MPQNYAVATFSLGAIVFVQGQSAIWAYHESDFESWSCVILDIAEHPD